MKIRIIFFCLVWLFISCSDSKKEYFDNGNLMQEYTIKDGRIEGLVKDYYKDGSLKCATGFKAGRQQGKQICYYENGEVKQEANFTNGVQVDTSKLFFENGQLMEVSIFSEGVMNGSYSSYYNSGKIKVMGNVKKGSETGIWDYYEETGEKSMSIFFESGIAISKFISSDPKMYINNVIEYEVKFPSSWTITNETRGVVQFENSEKTLTILVNENHENLDIKEFASRDKQIIVEKLKPKKVREFNETNSIGLRYTVKDNGKEFHAITSYKMIGEFVLIVTSKNEFPEYFQIVKSIEPLKDQS